jgi:hypothetical protein
MVQIYLKSQAYKNILNATIRETPISGFLKTAKSTEIVITRSLRL